MLMFFLRRGQKNNFTRFNSIDYPLGVFAALCVLVVVLRQIASTQQYVTEVTFKSI